MRSRRLIATPIAISAAPASAIAGIGVAVSGARAPSRNSAVESARVGACALERGAGEVGARDVPTAVSAVAGTVSGRNAPRVARQTQAPTRADYIALWARVFLGIVLGGMMTQWPYSHGCGLSLVEYLGAVAMVMVAGTWIAIASWRLRNAPSHVLGLLLLLWGIALASGQVLPRIGYAAQRWSWQC